MGGSTISNVVRGATDVMTFGTAEIGGASKSLGNMAGNALTGKPLGGSFNAPTVGGTQDPLSVLTSTGGAPLLMDISLGVDPKTALMGYFGGSQNFQTYNSWINSLSSEDRHAVSGVLDQLTQVQSNTDLRNQAVQKLANDFPNMMAQKIPQYSSMADDATKQVMKQAMDSISARQAAGGSFSSGATAEAAAKAGAGIAMDKLNYGTNMALQDFNNQYSIASGLQSFQQKMLGQGATQGFNAVQNALSRNTGIAEQQANLTNQANNANTQSQNALYGALGSLGGAAIGSMLMPGKPPGIPPSLPPTGNNSGMTGDAKLNLYGSGYGGSAGSMYGMNGGY